jgi:cell division protein FtsW (lipid II flippase)
MTFSASPSAPGTPAGGALRDSWGRGGASRLGDTFARRGSYGVDGPPDYLPYRRRELALLAFAGILATAALSAVVIAHDSRITTAVLYYGFGFFALWGTGHLAVRRFAPAADPVLLPLAAGLNGLGLVMIYRLDLANQDTARRLHKAAPRSAAELQLVWTLLAMVTFVTVLMVVSDHKLLARYSYTAGFAGLFFLVLPAMPGIGATINGARLWLRVGPFTFQPSEIAKILLMIFFAGYLQDQRKWVRVMSGRFHIRDLWPVLIAWLASIGVLVVEKDLGTSLLFFGVFLVILYVATKRVSWLIIGLVLFVIGAVAANAMFAHVQERVDIWLHAFSGANPSNQSFQLVQGLFGFAAGGITGSGLGHGSPQTVPFANTDFIMASMGEELGLIGVMAILLMYALIVMRGMRAAVEVGDTFGKLLATALSFGLALQVFVQVGGVMRLIPLTGLTLPFLSYGGSSVVSNAAVIALLLRISDGARGPDDDEPLAPMIDPGAVAEAHTEVVQR